jgi:hypothetical protein
MHLIVVKAFEKFVRGDIISDEKTVERILSSGNASFVIRVGEPRPTDKG